MLKKTILAAILISVVSISGIIIFEFLQKPKFGNELSERSKSFIQNQNLKGGINQYAPLVKEEKEDYRGKRVSVGNCFSFIMPFSVFNSREEGECSGYFAFERPRGSIVAFMESATSDSIENASGVSMRRLNKEKYLEKEIKIGNKELIGFVDKEVGSYSITVYQYINKEYFILTLNLPEEDEVKLKEILSSVQVN